MHQPNSPTNINERLIAKALIENQIRNESRLQEIDPRPYRVNGPTRSEVHNFRQPARDASFTNEDYVCFRPKEFGREKAEGRDGNLMADASVYDSEEFLCVDRFLR